MEKEKNERYVYCYEPYDGDSFIWDSKQNLRIDNLSVCANVMNTLNEEAERWKAHKEWDCKTIQEQGDKLEELEHRLANCIEPKFTIGQEVWGIDIVRKDNIDSFIVREICYCADYGLYYKTDIGVDVYEYYFKLFATEEEAKAKLEELKNG